MEPSLFIQTIRDSHKDAVNNYTKGGCYQFYKILKTKYPEAKAFYNSDHVITEIDGVYYDITGQVHKDKHLLMSQEEQEEAETWQKEQIMADTLNENNIKAIADTLGLTIEQITEAITNPEASFEAPEGDFFSQDQLSKRDSTKYNEGKKAGAEILVKKVRDEKGYDFQGSNIDDLLDAVKAETLSSSSKSKSEWEKTFETQKETYEAELAKERQRADELHGNFRKQKLTNKLLSLMPKETTIKSDAIITLFNSEYSVIEEEGIQYVTKGGEKLVDPKSTDPLAIDSVFSEFVTREGYVKPAQGRGEGNDTGDSGNSFTAKTPQDFQKQWQEKNPDVSPNSPKFMEDYTKHREAQRASA